MSEGAKSAESADIAENKESAGKNSGGWLSKLSKTVGVLATISIGIVTINKSVREVVLSYVGVGDGEATNTSTDNGPSRVETDEGGRRTEIRCPPGYALIDSNCLPPSPTVRLSGSTRTVDLILPSATPAARPSRPGHVPPLPCAEDTAPEGDRGCMPRSRFSAPPPLPPSPGPPTAPIGPFIVFFDWDSSAITPQSASILDNAAMGYLETGGASLTLAGHADRSGGADYNVGLSQRRATNVRLYLARRGAPDDLITTEAFGESRPLVDTADGVHEPQNRRVEITFGPGPSQ